MLTRLHNRRSPVDHLHPRFDTPRIDILRQTINLGGNRIGIRDHLHPIRGFVHRNQANQRIAFPQPMLLPIANQNRRTQKLFGIIDTQRQILIVRTRRKHIGTQRHRQRLRRTDGIQNIVHRLVYQQLPPRLRRNRLHRPRLPVNHNVWGLYRLINIFGDLHQIIL